MSRYNGDRNRLLRYSGVELWQHPSDLQFAIQLARACKKINSELNRGESANNIAEALRKLSLQLRFHTFIDAANIAYIFNRDFFTSESKKYCEQLFSSTLVECQKRFPILNSSEVLEVGGHVELAFAVKSQKKWGKHYCSHEKNRLFLVGNRKICLDSSSAMFGVQFDEIFEQISSSDLITRMKLLKRLLESVNAASYYTVFASDGDDNNKTFCFKKIKDYTKRILNESNPAEQSSDLLGRALEILGIHQDSLGFGNTNSLSDLSIQNFVLRHINDPSLNFMACVECLKHIKDRSQLRVCITALLKRINNNTEQLSILEELIKNSPIVKGRWFEISMQEELLQLVEANRRPTVVDGIVLSKNDVLVGLVDSSKLVVTGIPLPHRDVEAQPALSSSVITLFGRTDPKTVSSSALDYAKIFNQCAHDLWMKHLFPNFPEFTKKMIDAEHRPIQKLELWKSALNLTERNLVLEHTRKAWNLKEKLNSVEVPTHSLPEIELKLLDARDSGHKDDVVSGKVAGFA